MIKKIKLKGNPLQIKCKLLIDSCFSGCSDVELKLIVLLIQFSTNNSITLTPDLSRQVRAQTSIAESSFATYLFRLEKKNIFIKQGKTITFHPVFNNIDSFSSLLISFDIESIARIESQN